MPNFYFLEKGLGIVAPAYFVYDFSRKMFLILYCMSNMCTAIVFFPGFDVIKFEINLFFLIKPFFYMTKNSRQKFKYLENEKSF